MKYGVYGITVNKAMEMAEQFTARDGKFLFCLPRTAFTKIADEEWKKYMNGV